ncbi:MAG: hypothetical protein U1G07_10890 [Verrucomicrobiota bacterium]
MRTRRRRQSQEQPGKALDPAGEYPARQVAEEGRDRDPNHHGSGEQVSTRILRVILLVNLGHQWDGSGRGGPVEDAASHKDRQPGDQGHGDETEGANQRDPSGCLGGAPTEPGYGRNHHREMINPKLPPPAMSALAVAPAWNQRTAISKERSSRPFR